MDYHTIADFKLPGEERARTDGKGWKEKTAGPGRLRGDDFTVVFESIYNEAVQKQEPLKMVILGQPGSGKTTLMKWIALQAAQPANSPGNIFSRFIPVLIP